MVSRLTRIALVFVLPLSMAALVGCGKDNDVTGSGGALASLNLDVPGQVHSGTPFDISVSTTAIGVQNVQNGVVTVTLPAGVTATSADAEPGTSASISGSTVSWTLNTLDSNTSSTLTIHAMGSLPAGTPDQNLQVQASMTATGISSGELTATKDFTLMP